MPFDTDSLLRRLLHPDDAELLDLDPRPEHLPFVHQVATTDPKDILSLLLGATFVGGAVEPADDRGDVPWCRGIRRFDDDPRGGLHLGHQWFHHLEGLQWDGIGVSPVMMAVAAYAAALQEHRLGREVRARRWVRMAGVQTEGEARCGIGLVALVRARKLLLG